MCQDVGTIPQVRRLVLFLKNTMLPLRAIPNLSSCCTGQKDEKDEIKSKRDLMFAATVSADLFQNPSQNH